MKRNELEAAVKRFEEFTGLEAGKGIKLTVPDPPAVTVCLGELVGVIYKVKKQGARKNTEYIHKFERRPFLLTDPKGKNLFIAGGKIRVTERGIEG